MIAFKLIGIILKTDMYLIFDHWYVSLLRDLFQFDCVLYLFGKFLVLTPIDIIISHWIPFTLWDMTF